MEAVIRNGATNVAESQLNLPDAGSMPDLGGAVGWLNSAPLDRKSPRGKVVMIDFWTYSCINCLRALLIEL
jgi:thiol-disulfide isomerase/thioredoxin